MECFNVFGGSCGAKARIGIIANNEIGCIGGDLAVSNSTCGNAAAYRQQADNDGRDPKAMGYILVQSPGGGGALKKFLYVEALPQGPTPYPFMHHFSRKRYPFRIPSIEKWYSFHIPC